MFYHLKINFNVILEIYNVPKFCPYDVKSVVH